MEHFNSDAKQDKFVAHILNFKRGGYFLDIGSCHSIMSNNSYYFESLNWKGICVELQPGYNDSYNLRKCKFINGDATTLDYATIFKNENFPQSIDYLSLDIDELSYNVLTILPHSEYKFKVITIEHDFYLHGDTYQAKQRQLLNDLGYLLICSNVYVEQSGFHKPNCPFEDWWIDPTQFDSELINKIKSENLYPSQIISKF